MSRDLTEFLRIKGAAHFLSISERTLYRLSENDPTFPQKRVINSRCVGYLKADLEQWLKQLEGVSDE